MMTNCPGYLAQILLESKARLEVYASIFTSLSWQTALSVYCESEKFGAGDAT